MELDEFVRRTIEQVITGVSQACKHAKENGAMITSNRLQPIEFDVAVTTTEGSESKKSGGIAVWGLGLNAQGRNEMTNSSVSRIKFTVMVALPTSKKEQPEFD